MNINFLPQKIRNDLKNRFGGKNPFSAVRISGTLDGETGEGYILALEDLLLFLDRKTGKNDFKIMEFNKGFISGKLRKEGFNIYLDTEIGGKKYSIRFSPSEESDLKQMMGVFIKEENAVGDLVNKESDVSETDIASKQVSERRDESEKNTSEKHCATVPIILLAAGMMYIAKSDESVAKEEDFYIVSVMNYNRQILSKALEYYKTHNFDEFIKDCDSLEEVQQLCLLANMLEIAMKDGELKSQEQKMISKMVDELKIDQSQYDAIRQVLLIKNKTSVME